MEDILQYKTKTELVLIVKQLAEAAREASNVDVDSILSGTGVAKLADDMHFHFCTNPDCTGEQTCDSYARWVTVATHLANGYTLEGARLIFARVVRFSNFLLSIPMLKGTQDLIEELEERRWFSRIVETSMKGKDNGKQLAVTDESGVGPLEV